MPPKIEGIVWDTPQPDQIVWDAAPSQDYQRKPATWGEVVQGAPYRAVAGMTDLLLNTPVNIYNLGKAAYGTAVTAAGRPDLAPELTPNFTPVTKALQTTGAIGYPQIANKELSRGQRVADIGLQSAFLAPVGGGPNVLRNVALGGISGVTGQATTEATGSPYAGLVVGALTPLGISGVKTGATAAYKGIMGKPTDINTVLAQAFNNDPARMQQAIGLLNQGLPIEQVAVKMQSPELAALYKSSLQSQPSLNVSRQEQQRQQSVGRLKQAETQLTQIKSNQPAPTTQATDAQQPAVDVLTQQQRSRSSVPKADQQQVGDVIAARNEALKQKATEAANVLYKDAYDKAGNTPIDFSGVETAAGKLRNEATLEFDPNLAPETKEILTRFQTKVTPAKPAEVDAVGMLRSPATPEVVTPPKVTLEEAHGLLKALNKDYGTALRQISAGKEGAATLLSNVKKLRESVYSSLKNSLGEDSPAYKAFIKAQENYKSTVFEPHEEGWVSKFERLGTTKEPQLAGSKVTSTVMSTPENVDKFISVFGKDKEAVVALRNGILDNYGNSTVRKGIISQAQHDTFLRNFGAQIDKLDKAIPGLNLRQQIEKYATQTSEIKAKIDALNKQLKASGKSTVNSDQADEIQQLQSLYNSVSKGTMPVSKRAVTTSAEMAPVDQDVLTLADKVPGLKDEILAMMSSREFNDLASKGKSVNELLPTQPKVGAKIDSFMYYALDKINPSLPYIKVALDWVKRAKGAKFAENNEQVIAQIAKQLSENPTQAVTNALKSATTPKTVVSIPSQLTNALLRNPASAAATGILTNQLQGQQ